MTQPSTSQHPQLRTKFRRERTFEPIYTGGAATAFTPDGKYLFAPVNETIHITHVTTGKTVNKIPSDLEEVTCLTLTHDGSILIVASRSLAIRVIELEYRTTTPQDSDTGEGPVAAVSWKVLRNISKTHDAPVVVMNIDPTDTLLATGSSDGCAKVWDIRGGFCTHVFRNHGGIVSALEWNMPMKKSTSSLRGSSERVMELITGSIDGRVRVWNLHAQTERGPQRPSAVLESHFSVVRGLAVDQDGARMVSAGRDRLLTFWTKEKERSNKSRSSTGLTAAGWTVVDSVTTGESMESAGFVTGDTFWTAGAEGEIRLWSFDSRKITNVQPQGRFARGIASKRKAVKSLEQEEDDEDEGDETRSIMQVHSLPLLNALISVHADQNFVFRKVPNLHPMRRLVGFNDQIIDMALLSPGTEADTHLAVATNTNAISVYTLGTEEHSVELLPNDTDLEQGHSGLVLCLDKTSDGRWLASGAKDRSVRVWARVPKGSSTTAALHDDSLGHPVSRNGNHSVTPATEELEWRCVAVGEGHTESVGAVAFARRPAFPDAEGAPFLVSGSQDRTAKVWDLSSLSGHVAQFGREDEGKPLQLKSLTTLKIHDKDINALDVSPNNALLLSGSQDKTAKVFSINYVPPSKSNNQTSSASLKLLTVCRGHKRGVWSVAFSSNDAVFLTGSGDRSMKLWSINDDFSCIKNYIGHTNSILRVRFLKGSKGLQCLSCASDGLVKVWNVKTEECLDTLDGHEDRVWGLECSRDGDVIISGAADSFICFWRDWTLQQEQGKIKERQEEVEREQQFVNLLALKDYRNAISLALAMNQPRRLFNLFQAVDAGRKRGDATTSMGELLTSALQLPQSDASSTIDPSLQALVSAGVLSSASAARVVGAKVAKNEGSSIGPTSITGSSSVDQVIETLHPAQLRTLLGFVRDWNTSTRTSHIAQNILHAVLRFHSADQIIAAYEKPTAINADDDVTAPDATPKKSRFGQRNDGDLKAVVEAILPYTKRHYDRAQRLLTESAVLQYTLSCMDAVLGTEMEEDEVKDKNKEFVNGNHTDDITMGESADDGVALGSSDADMFSEQDEE